jgi:hypothetical protein
MNREIKFRAYHKLLNIMIGVDAIDFSGGTIRKGDKTIQAVRDYESFIRKKYGKLPWYCNKEELKRMGVEYESD